MKEMKGMKKICTSLLAAALFAGSISAQTLPSLLTGSDAASLGTASASVGKASGAYSLEGNVASMSFNEDRLSAGVSFGLWQPSYAEDKIIGAGASYRPGDRFALGLQFKNLRQPSYDIVSENGSVKGSFTPGETSIALGAAYSITDFLSVGVTGRMVRSTLGEDASAGVFGADAALFFRKDALSAGLSVNNLGGKVNYGGDDYNQPTLVRVGSAYRFGDPKASAVTPSVEADMLFEGGFMAGAGVEYSYKSMLFARGGVHYGDEEKAVPTYVSLGLGARFMGVSLDVAYLTANDILGNTITFGLGYRF